MYEQIKTKIEKKEAVVGVLGLGYVGLPLLLEFCKAGFKVVGFDPAKNRISNLLNNEKYITDVEPSECDPFIKAGKFVPTFDETKLAEADIFIICVPTPLRHVKDPDMSYIISATETIVRQMKKGSLVILESTTYPGTSREVILPKIEDKGFILDKDFFLCFSPERVDPGNKNFPIRSIPKVVGGISTKSTDLGKMIYATAMDRVVPVSTIETAETVKLLENTFRLVNIGLINEFAIICDKLGIDVWEVIEGSKTKPFGFMPFYPGPGLGGHCIPCDPMYLSWKARQMGFRTEMIDLAANTNRYMPKFVSEKIWKLTGKDAINEVKVLLVGVTYKKDVKDLRESPSLDIIDIFHEAGADVQYYDPHIPFLKVGEINMNSIELTAEALKEYDCVAIITDHSDLDYKFIRENSKLVYDTRCAYKELHENVVRL